jgi:hypothetical protein
LVPVGILPIVGKQLQTCATIIDWYTDGLVQLPTGTPMDWYPSVFYRELENNYGLVPQLPMGTPMDWYPSVFYLELEKNYGLVPQLPTGTSTESAHPEAHACQRRGRLARLPTELLVALFPMDWLTNRKVKRDF